MFRVLTFNKLRMFSPRRWLTCLKDGVSREEVKTVIKHNELGIVGGRWAHCLTDSAVVRGPDTLRVIGSPKATTYLEVETATESLPRLPHLAQS